MHFDIFNYNCTQNVLTYDHNLCCLLEKTNLTKIGVWREIRWPRNIFLMCGNKKTSLGAKSALCGGWPINSTFCPPKKALIWADVREHAFSLRTMIRLFLFVFRISPKKLWCTLLMWNSHYMTSFAEETGDHLLRSAFATNNFRWIWIGFKVPIDLSS